MVKDAFCSTCGAAYPKPLAYPRRCASCGAEAWSNPIPVAVVLLPIRRGGRTGLLVVRRGIAPKRGRLALAGGFVDHDESWQAAGAREVFEETGIVIEAASLAPFWFASSEPVANRVLLFGVAAPIDGSVLPPLPDTPETLERGLVFGPEGLDPEFAFDLHVRAARRWFEAHGTVGPHDYAPI